MRTYARPINRSNNEVVVPMFDDCRQQLEVQKQYLKPGQVGSMYPINRDGILNLVNNRKALPIIAKGADDNDIVIFEYEIT